MFNLIFPSKEKDLQSCPRHLISKSEVSLL